MATLKYKEEHNKVGYLLKPTGSDDYHQIIDFLSGSHIRYALTSNPIIFDSLVKQFWSMATLRESELGPLAILATIDKTPNTTEAPVRSRLHLADDEGVVDLPISEIYFRMDNLGYVTEGKLTFFKKKFSPQWRGMVNNIGNAKKFLMYPRFLQTMLGIETRVTKQYKVLVFSRKLFTNMRLNFARNPMPLLPAMLLQAQAGEGAEVAAQDVPHPVPARDQSPAHLPTPSRPQSPDLVAPVLEHDHSSAQAETVAGSIPTTEDEPLGGDLHPSRPWSSHAPPAGQPSGGEEDPITLTALSFVVSTLVQKVHSLEAELHDHKKLFKDVVGKLVKKVKSLEVKLKTKKRKLVVMAADLDIPSGNTSHVPSAIPPGASSVAPGAPGVALGASGVAPGASGVSFDSSVPPTAASAIPADSPKVHAGASSKGKSPMVKEDIPVTARSFRQREEDRLGWDDSAFSVFTTTSEDVEEDNTNDLASSDSGLKSSEHKPTDSSGASTSSVSTSVNGDEIDSNVRIPTKEPISVQDFPSFTCNSFDKNEHSSRTCCNKHGSFNKRQDCDFYEKQMTNTTVGIGVGPTVRPQLVPTGTSKVKPVSNGKPKATPVPTGRPRGTPVPTGKPKATPVPTGKPKGTPVPTGKPTVHPVPTGKPKFTPVPTGRLHRPFPVATDRGCSPSVPSGWWSHTAAPLPYLFNPTSSYFQPYTPYVPTMYYNHMQYGRDRWATAVKPSAALELMLPWSIKKNNKCLKLLVKNLELPVDMAYWEDPIRHIETSTTPYEAPKPKSKSVSDSPVNVHLYKSMIGSLMYLTDSRPDIMFAVSVYSKHQVTPTTSNLEAVKKIFKYLKGQPKLGLWYHKESPLVLKAYSDSDYAGANKDRKSTTNRCQFLGTLDTKSVVRLWYEAEHNKVGYLLKPTGSDDYHSIIDFLRSLHIRGMVSNIGNAKKCLMYLRFLQTILGIETRVTRQYKVLVFSRKLFANMRLNFTVLEHDHSSDQHETADGSFPTREDAPLGGDFHTSPPRSSYAYPKGQPSGAELHDHKKLFKDVVEKLVKKVKTLKVKLKTKKRKMVVSDSDQEDDDTHNVDLDALRALANAAVAVDLNIPSSSTSQVPVASPCAPTAVPAATLAVPANNPTVPTAVPAATLAVPANNPTVPTAVPADSLNVPAGISRKGKSPMVEADIPVKARTFRKMEEDRLGEEAAKRLHDEEMAHMERERTETQRKRQLEVLEFAMYYNESDWLNIRAQVEANASLSKTQLEPLTKRPKSPEAPTPSMPEVPISPVVTSPPSSCTRQKSLGQKHMHKPKSTLLTLDLDVLAQTFLKVVVDEDLNNEDSVDEVWSTVVGWEILPNPLGAINALYRIDGSTKHFATLCQILHLVDRQDLVKLYGLVVQYYEHHPAAGAGLLFWGDLQVLFDSQAGGKGSSVWQNQHLWEIQSWQLYTLSNVHVLETISGEVLSMFADVTYPLSVELIKKMLMHKLEIDLDFVGNDLTIAEQLI
nr:ribonuclease H-like domain, reverse transcriptase, RNA-dependent DNA polymerase [Tanacetum cinerariifolium]